MKNYSASVRSTAGPISKEDNSDLKRYSVKEVTNSLTISLQKEPPIYNFLQRSPSETAQYSDRTNIPLSPQYTTTDPADNTSALPTQPMHTYEILPPPTSSLQYLPSSNSQDTNTPNPNDPISPNSPSPNHFIYPNPEAG